MLHNVWSPHVSFDAVRHCQGAHTLAEKWARCASGGRTCVMQAAAQKLFHATGGIGPRLIFRGFPLWQANGRLMRVAPSVTCVLETGVMLTHLTSCFILVYCLSWAARFVLSSARVCSRSCLVWSRSRLICRGLQLCFTMMSLNRDISIERQLVTVCHVRMKLFNYANMPAKV